MLGCLLACQDDEPLFDKSADERAREAIAELKSKLTTPAEGWLLRYRPENESGVYNVLLDFEETDEVTIRTDFGVNDGEFYEQTITYRIDNSLGLELIFENYSFFSFLFEQEQASFLAEFEFNYVNETPDGALVFSSKSDPSSPTRLVFLPATGNEINLLGTEVAGDLNTLTENSLAYFASSYRLRFTNRDLSFYLTLDNFRRTLNINFVSADGSATGQSVDFSTPYTIQGEEVILDEPFTGNYFGQEITIPAIRFGTLSETTLMACGQPVTANQYTASVGGAPAVLENSLFDPNGANVFDQSEFFYSLNQNIFNDDGSLGAQIDADVPGSLAMLLYYDQRATDPFYALGFFIVNESGSITRALREFTPSLEGNRMQVAFDSAYTVLEDTTGTFDEAKIDRYLNLFSEGEGAYIYKLADETYEFYNPCNGTSFVFFHN